MKSKYAILTALVVLCMGFVLAAQDMGARDGTGEFHDEIVAAGGQEGVVTTTQYGGPQARIQGEGQLMLENGETLRFSQENGNIRLNAGNSTVNCKECNLSGENGKLKAMLSNGRNAEIKVMPSTASERALERLRLKVCNESCSIELKEVGEGNNSKIAYEFKAEKRAKVFGIFGTNMEVETQIDAETGEVIKTRRPWWSFISSEEEEAISSE